MHHTTGLRASQAHDKKTPPGNPDGVKIDLEEPDQSIRVTSSESGLRTFFMPASQSPSAAR